MTEKVENDTWMIGLNNDESFIVYDFINAQHSFATGQPKIELYDNEQDWLNRLSELGITPIKPLLE